MKYELATVEKEISPKNLCDIFHNKPNLKVNKTSINETDQIFNLPIAVLVRYQCILNSFSELFIKEQYRISKVMKDQKILDDAKISNYVLINYKGLLNLYEEADTQVPENIVDANFRFHDDIKESITKQIKYSLQTQFVIPLMTMIQSEFPEILIFEGYLDSPEKSFFEAIKASKIVIEHIASKAKTPHKTGQYSLQFNSFFSVDNYLAHLDHLFDDFKKSIQKNYPIAINRLTDLEKLSAHKSTINEVYARFHQDLSKKVKETPYPLYTKMDASVNLERELPSGLSSDEYKTLQYSLNKFTTAQYHFTKNALELIDQRIEMVMFSGFSNQVTDNLSPPIQESPLLKFNTQLSVPQIAYLFRCLNMERGILQEKNKAGLFRKIAAHFTSSRKDHVSVDSIRNNFNMPEENAIEFWLEKFTHLMQIAKEDRKNLRR